MDHKTMRSSARLLSVGLLVCSLTALLHAQTTRPAEVNLRQAKIAMPMLDRSSTNGRMAYPMSEALLALLKRPGLAQAVAQTRLPGQPGAVGAVTAETIARWIEQNQPAIVGHRTGFELQLAAGRADDAVLRAAVDRSAEILQDYHFDRPPVTAALLQLARAGQLNTRELELTLRILDDDIANVMALVARKPSAFLPI